MALDMGGRREAWLVMSIFSCTIDILHVDIFVSVYLLIELKVLTKSQSSLLFV